MENVFEKARKRTITLVSGCLQEGHLIQNSIFNKCFSEIFPKNAKKTFF